MKNALLVLVFLLAACARQAPDSFSISPEFSPEVRETIRAAVFDWCDATGDCPEEVGWSERGRFELVESLGDDSDDPDCPEGRTCIRAGNNDGDVIRIARDRPDADDLSVTWTIAAHEWGHYCIEGHLDDGLMAAVRPTALAVDSGAVRAWHDGCHSATR